MNTLIHIQDLSVSYGKGNKRLQAVRGISFDVFEGECVGFIGANGAGKSTTIKTLMGFTYADAGIAEVCGHAAGDPAGRKDVGYLPEVALYYPFMKAAELLELYGTLGGLSRAEVRDRTPKVLAQVGLSGKEGLLLRTFSKGMQQRLGIAQALITEPKLLVLDEISSGLDPIGRYDLRVLLEELKAAGRTIFFSSHELSEVESLCDRVILIDQGKILREVTRDELHAIGRERSLESFFISEVRKGTEAHV